MPTTTTDQTVHELAAQGFSPAEIARLQQLKDRYHPFRELCESNHEFERLAFLKWRWMHGQVERG